MNAKMTNSVQKRVGYIIEENPLLPEFLAR